MNASTEQPPIRKTKPTPRVLDLQQIFSWLLADGVIEKADVKTAFNQAQALLRNATMAMHPLTAVAQCKLQSALPPPSARH